MDWMGAEGFDAALNLTERLNHLSSTKRRELARVLEVIFDEVERYQATKTTERKRRGKILKVILFGSYARGNWVEDRLSGYRSDYDLLIVVNDQIFAESEDLWLDLDDRLTQLNIAGHIKTPTNAIVHSLRDINNQLARGRPFFVDLFRDGKTLYEADGHPLAETTMLTAQDIKEEAERYFREWMPGAIELLALAEICLARGSKNLAAFNLHQATERTYHTFLLTLTLYSPKLHRIKTLRSKAEDIDTRLIGAWPRDTRLGRRRFELLSRAYVEARYSPKFEITNEEIGWLVERVTSLQGLVQEICLERLECLPKL
ncbi:HEPN domain-containing protein [Rhizobium sp.]|uniref:HEPN domain-containing protein n=1 Tax=Rhizobium sp. TaxID=391 RepID=UPI0028B0B497